MTLPPSAAKEITTFPIPVIEPVINAVLPFNCKCMITPHFGSLFLVPKIPAPFYLYFYFLKFLYFCMKTFEILNAIKPKFS